MVVWLVFSVLKKVIGLIALAAVAAGAFILWQNPDLLRALLVWLQQFFG